jgi:hypothetical protein
MTIEQLRKYKGCEHYSDEDAAEVVSSLRTLAIILIETWPKICSDNQCNSKSINSNPLIVNHVKKAA